MKIHKVPQHIRDAPLPAGYVWHDGDETHWPLLRIYGSIGYIAAEERAYLCVKGFEEVDVENIDQAFNLINARILLGDGP